MFRRIEIISTFKHKDGTNSTCKSGLMGVCDHEDIVDAWIDGPKGPEHLYKNCRFFFTEDGWNLYGRKTIEACQRHGQKYRVICVRECSVDVFFRDTYEVAVRPRKHKH